MSNSPFIGFCSLTWPVRSGLCAEPRTLASTMSCYLVAIGTTDCAFSSSIAEVWALLAAYKWMELHTLQWSGRSCLLNNLRGIGWSCEVGAAALAFCHWSADWLTQVSNLPPRPSEAGWQFVRKKLLSAFLFIDLAQTYRRSNPLFLRWDVDLWSQGYLMLPVIQFAGPTHTVRRFWG